MHRRPISTERRRARLARRSAALEALESRSLVTESLGVLTAGIGLAVAPAGWWGRDAGEAEVEPFDAAARRRRDAEQARGRVSASLPHVASEAASSRRTSRLEATGQAAPSGQDDWLPLVGGAGWVGPALASADAAGRADAGQGAGSPAGTTSGAVDPFAPVITPLRVPPPQLTNAASATSPDAETTTFRSLAGPVAEGSGVETTAATSEAPLTDAEPTLVEGEPTLIEADPTFGDEMTTASGGSGGTTLVTISNPATDAGASETPLNNNPATPDKGVFTVSRGGGDLSTSLTVNYTVSGTASNGSDYQTLPGSITIPAGQGSAIVEVVPIDDTAVEGSETVVVTLAAGTGYSVYYPDNSTVTIADNDTSSITVSIRATRRETVEGSATPAVFTVSRTGSTASALTVSYTASGTATSGTDYTSSPAVGSVTIPAGASSATIDVTALTDSTREGVETATFTLTAGAGYAVGSPDKDTVQINDAVAPKVLIDDGGSAVGSDVDRAGGGPGGASYSGPTGVDLADGSVAVGAVGGYLGGDNDLNLSWSNLGGYAGQALFGSGMVDANLPSLVQTAGGGILAVVAAGQGLWFDYNAGSGTYTPKFFLRNTLVVDGPTGDFILTDTDGSQHRFAGFGAGVPPARRGQFKSRTDAYGNTTSVTSWTADGKIAEVQRNVTTGGVTTTESYLYAYVAGGANAGLVQSITLRRKVGAGAWTTVRQTDHAYYDGSQVGGNAGDLQTTVVKDALGNALETTYFRYYTPGEANGYAHGLKYVVGPRAYARLAAAVGNPLTASDAHVAPYADRAYEYDALQRVSKATILGAGDSNQPRGTFTYTYTTSAFADGYNSWKTKTVETLPNGNRNIVFANYAGEQMLRVFDDLSDPANAALSGKKWITYSKYDAQGRLILTARPSAVTGYDETKADLLNFQSGVSAYLSDTAGVIDTIEYGASTTATATAAGDVVGFRKAERTQVGELGTSILLAKAEYFTRAAGTATSYPLARETVYRNADGTGGAATSYAYTWYAGTHGAQSVAVTKPIVTTAQNGPGSADVATISFDAYGRPTWTKDGDGFLAYAAYDDATGAVTKSITDVNTAQTTDFTGLPAGWATPAGGGLHLITTARVDALGRTTKLTDPLGNVTYTVYDDPDYEVRTYRGWTGSAPTGPTEVVREDRAGGYVEVLTTSATPTAANGEPTGAESFSSSNIWSLSRDYTDVAGRLVRSDRYSSLSGVTYARTAYIGTAGTNYYSTTYGYKDGLLTRVQSPTGTITATTYDGLRRPATVSVGTNDSASGGGNMLPVESYQYDGNGVGDGNLTQRTENVDATATRVTAYAYDTRGRLVAAKEGVQGTESTAVNRPITYFDRDNLGRVTAVSRYDGDTVALSAAKPAASLLRAYEVTKYDEQGRVYQELRYSVDPATGAVSTGALTTSTWYDRRGNPIKVASPGGLVTKVKYDGAGRPTTQYTTNGGGDAAWADADDVTGDIVLEQVETTYDKAGNATLVTTRERFHDALATETGGLGTPTSASPTPKARVSYVASYYDAANRLTATADVGTNGGTAYARPGTVPARSDTVLVTSRTYNSAGLLDTTTDPRGIVAKTKYDLLGRVTESIEAYDAAVNGGLPTASRNATTRYTYDGADHQLTVTAVMPSGTPNQVTQYVYGVTTAGGSAINSNDLLAEIRQPDKATGNASTLASDRTSFKYNRRGQATSLTDPNGTVHAYAYDAPGRQVSDAVTTLGTGVDGAVRRLETAYDGGGRAYLFTSYNAASAGSVVNQVQRAYNGLGQLTAEYQERGVVSTATSPKVQYAYSEMAGGANHSRPTLLTYPSGRKVHFVYDAGTDASISRLSALADDNAGVPGTRLEAYSYVGLDTIVKRAHVQPGVDLTSIKQVAEPVGDAGDPYTGLDRFGRVIDQRWLKTSTGVATDRFQYGYDRAGQRLYRANLVDTALSELYHANSSAAGDDNTAYDPLGRLTAFRRGTLSASGNNGTKLDTVTTASRSQSWSLDALGNWSSQTTGGTTTTRGFNAQNQTTSATGGGATTPSYDSAGNTTASNGQTFVHDAWNRLVAVKSGTTTLASYAYDALGRRITETAGATTDQLYYSPDWQVLEERRGGTAAANLSQQYVWGKGYVDRLVLRDSYNAGAFTQRLYAQQDAQHNVTALINTAGVVQERYLYDPYGVATVTDASYVPRAGNASSFDWRYLHQGGRLDATSGWYSFRHRDYIASEGRWAQRDPLGLAAGDRNLYRYVGNSPTSAVDPSGLAGDLLEDIMKPDSGGGRPWGAGLNHPMNVGGYTGHELANQLVPGSVPRVPDYMYDGRTSTASGGGIDGFQDYLDKLGVVDPTGIADGLNALIYLARRQYGNAAISAAGALLPYAGDLAKLGRYTRYSDEAAAFARSGTGAFQEGAKGGAGLGKLADRSINVTQRGVETVRKHLSRPEFLDDAGKVWGPNEAMIRRLEQAAAQGKRVDGADASFYLHEVSEATMMGRRGMDYDAAHELALQRYQVSPFSVYHPDVIRQFADHFNNNWRRFWGIAQ